MINENISTKDLTPFLIWGQAYSGRYLFIVFRYLGIGSIKVITAREMMDKDKKFYLRRVK